ncbi:hypothetical protein ACFY2R_01790 [Micromonospora olivasterospora]|uniref:Uncharacterized protein n=1 Tax=Micromonospora olivasterospora TaxID=1880 RepID=A0A562ICS2_MICOL|nr:hypothetical protein [Micromonospora olivasterospora]TWH68588.1 hypothetical protein JD77_03585 [Micromonospora olivasterospora]
MTARQPGRSGLVTLGACLGLGAWFVASVLSQHPQRVFDKLRRHDPTGTMLPDWRFFAPEPAQHDFVLLVRCLGHDGAESPWESVVEISPRAWTHGFWHPARRMDKAVHDLCDQLTRHLGLLGDDGTSTPAYALMRGVVERHVRAKAGGPPPKGFQFVIARAAGYDDREEPEYVYLSRFESL